MPRGISSPVLLLPMGLEMKGERGAIGGAILVAVGWVILLLIIFAVLVLLIKVGVLFLGLLGLIFLIAIVYVIYRAATTA
jgi:hypothetical protein